MKSKGHIVASILAMYILSLPIILFFHSKTHSQVHLGNGITVVESDFGDITEQDNISCEICSFYFDQQLYTESPFVYQIDFFSGYYYKDIIASPVVLFKEQKCPRGPPRT